MNKKLHETTSVCVEIMNSKRQVNEKLSHLIGTNSRLPFDVNVRLNLYYRGYFTARQRYYNAGVFDNY